MNDPYDDRIEELAAIIDGSETFTREAFVHLLGMTVLFLDRSGLIDKRQYAEFLRINAAPRYHKEDNMGQLIIDFRKWLDLEIELYWPENLPANLNNKGTSL